MCAKTELSVGLCDIKWCRETEQRTSEVLHARSKIAHRLVLFCFFRPLCTNIHEH